jgi:hypothetical protein
MSPNAPTPFVTLGFIELSIRQPLLIRIVAVSRFGWTPRIGLKRVTALYKASGQRYGMHNTHHRCDSERQFIEFSLWIWDIPPFLSRQTGPVCDGGINEVDPAIQELV